ncbi:uncharacterized protein SCHCODRAFT_01139207 [Schizophyllum commune H4-8]|uniref:LYR motif-containing protein Cup1-like N-terminal domain-containing protein n=1 Tax=Schizophyllum commune (strain H4-8 / FGSC 9210) TaxID=578458 RepID=D8PRW6_SCHCM|nr:uncharacterized protein SCHCODRAFT_01139207 [Schizophyllum commune H4-8]KAI5897889.1 hypothetical protein SCHCODRAFT_01139207 [Schizophyllum commune H4-8]
MSVASLYRTCHREIRRFPDSYLREFFLLKLRDDCHTILHTKGNDELRSRRLKRLGKEAKRLHAANQRNVVAYDKLLSIAYGRMGKLKYELMEPLLTDPSAPPPPPLIPGVERSRPPVYSRELKALLTSGISHTTRPLLPEDIQRPKVLGGREDPKSEESRIYGPLSKRREVNLRKKFFAEEWKKVNAPLEVVAERPLQEKGTAQDVLDRAGIRGFGFQGLGLFAHIERMAGKRKVEDEAGTTATPAKQPSYWLRRRYQVLLGRIPILTGFVRTQKPNQTGKNLTKGKDAISYSVNMADYAVRPSKSRTPDQMPELTADHLAWYDSAERTSTKSKSGKRAK